VPTGGADPVPRLRAEIDSIDDLLLALLNRRVGVAMELGRLKRDLLPEIAGMRLKDREAAVLERLARTNAGPLPHAALVRIFNEIFGVCLDAQGADGP
jgi:chorismate mutase/prephenate dehydratase